MSKYYLNFNYLNVSSIIKIDLIRFFSFFLFCKTFSGHLKYYSSIGKYSPKLLFFCFFFMDVSMLCDYFFQHVLPTKNLSAPAFSFQPSGRMITRYHER